LSKKFLGFSHSDLQHEHLVRLLCQGYRQGGGGADGRYKMSQALIDLTSSSLFD